MKKHVPALLILLLLAGWQIYVYASGKVEQEKTAASLTAERPSNKGGASAEPSAGDFALQTLEGDLIKLSDFAGKTVLVNFWASWCKPCSLEMPELISLAEAQPDLAVLAVNLTHTETSLDDVADFARRFNMPFPVLIDESGSIAARYGITSYPTTLVVSADGMLTETIAGQTERKTLERILALLND
ncbi:TlpA family protein disulfide reductase [Paenibacillus beijingensis]|uniref:Thioredoxin domain-containing protein n=1 Tax=Paenibacillus beijingensis TaxID=1126833 RepID=A0A0D5NP14_9BACL|nr:TlpA disulfide reductase family protein [Paenibacillus beijingensis]AJY76905.1 hypothetical protein VN24_23010 [Paenibacillus beijingensis]